MINKILTLPSSVWNNCPEISRDTVSKAAQAALQQLPWVAGTAASLCLYSSGVGLGTLLVVSVIGSNTAGLACTYYLNSQLPAEEKAAKIIQILKITVAAYAVLHLGFSLQIFYRTAMVLKTILPLTTYSASLVKLASIFQSLYIGKFIFQTGLSWKATTETFHKNWKEVITRFAQAYNEGKPGKIWALVDEMGYGEYISSLQTFYFPPSGLDVIDYLKDNPGQIQKAVTLFPHFFSPSQKLIQLLSFVHFDGRSEMQPAKEEIKAYLLNKYTSPITEDHLAEMKTWVDGTARPTLVQINDSLQQIKRFNALVEEISRLIIQHPNATTNSIIQKQRDLLEMAKQIKQLRNQLLDLRTGLAADHLQQVPESGKAPVGMVLDDIGLTFGDYKLLANRIPHGYESSSRMQVVKELNDRGIYCLHDLLQKNILGNNRTETLQRVANFLDNEPLQPIDPKRATHSKVQIVAAVFFNGISTAASLAVQMVEAPILTSSGFAYGFLKQQNAFNPLRSYRLPQTSLFFPVLLANKCLQTAQRILNMILMSNTKTGTGRVYAFLAGINQGETVRDYVTQTSEYIHLLFPKEKRQGIGQEVETRPAIG